MFISVVTGVGAQTTGTGVTLSCAITAALTAPTSVAWSLTSGGTAIATVASQQTDSAGSFSSNAQTSTLAIISAVTVDQTYYCKVTYGAVSFEKAVKLDFVCKYCGMCYFLM